MMRGFDWFRKLMLSRGGGKVQFDLKSDERKLPETTLEGPTGKYRAQNTCRDGARNGSSRGN
jgi:hypothetical protein